MTKDYLKDHLDLVLEFCTPIRANPISSKQLGILINRNDLVIYDLFDLM
ncbi:unnamed protein product, partial [Brachionus calyciflorus]